MNGQSRELWLVIYIGPVLKAAGFFVVVTIAGAWVFPTNPPGWFRHVPFIGRFGIQSLFAFGRGEYALLAIVFLALGVGLLADGFGFHPAVGAYMAGLILRDEYFQTKESLGSYASIKRTIDLIAFTVIGPVFFVNLGTNLVLEWDLLVSVIPHIVTLTVALLVSQIVSAALAARYTSAMDWRNSLMIGFGMLGRAELAFVVMDIAYVQNDILSTEAFYTLMCTAFWLNVAVPITITL